MLRVNELELLQVFNTVKPMLLSLLESGKVSPTKSLENSQMTLLMLLVLLLKVIKNITNTQTIAAYLVSISRANALSCSTDLVLTLCCLNSAVEQTVGWKDKMSFLGNVQTLSKRMTTLSQVLCFLHEEIRSQDDAITDNIQLTTLEDTRRNTAQNILLTFKLKCMTCIRTALKACYYIIAWCKNVYNLTFTFIAPLQTEQDINFTCIHFLNVILFLFLSCFPQFSFAWPVDAGIWHRPHIYIM